MRGRSSIVWSACAALHGLCAHRLGTLLTGLLSGSFLHWHWCSLGQLPYRLELREAAAKLLGSGAS